jgi:hypothetical protein
MKKRQPPQRIATAFVCLRPFEPDCEPIVWSVFRALSTVFPVTFLSVKCQNNCAPMSSFGLPQSNPEATRRLFIRLRALLPA